MSHLPFKRGQTSFQNLSPRSSIELMQLVINFDFLHAAVNHWDSNHHLFLFKGDEIIPLPGEFEALLGFPTNTLHMPYLPTLSDLKPIF